MMVRLLIETIPVIVIENGNDQEEGLRGTNNEQMISSELEQRTKIGAV